MEIRPIRPIRTDADYQAALGEVSAYFDTEPEPGTPEGDRFEVLLTLVEAYETRHFPIDLPDRAIDATGPGLVCDPFAGSGTTLLAARKAGVRAIGIEKSERYCEMAAARCGSWRHSVDNEGSLFGGVA